MFDKARYKNKKKIQIVLLVETREVYIGKWSQNKYVSITMLFSWKFLTKARYPFSHSQNDLVWCNGRNDEQSINMGISRMNPILTLVENVCE